MLQPAGRDSPAPRTPPPPDLLHSRHLFRLRAAAVTQASAPVWFTCAACKLLLLPARVGRP